MKCFFFSETALAAAPSNFAAFFSLVSAFNCRHQSRRNTNNKNVKWTFVQWCIHSQCVILCACARVWAAKTIYRTYWNIELFVSHHRKECVCVRAAEKDKYNLIWGSTHIFFSLHEQMIIFLFIFRGYISVLFVFSFRILFFLLLCRASFPIVSVVWN